MMKAWRVALIFCFAPAAFAQTYLVPDGDCGAVTLHAARGPDFPKLREAVPGDRVTRAYLHVPKRRIAVQPTAGPFSLTLPENVPENGVVMAEVDFAPILSGDETRTDHAKAFVRCGAIARGDDWQISTGQGLEIVPQWNGLMPLKAGQSMRFIAIDPTVHRLLHDVPMELYRADAGHVASGTLDKNGGVNFPYEQPGRYMVTATYRRPDPQQPHHWLVDTSTLTFEMK